MLVRGILIAATVLSIAACSDREVSTKQPTADSEFKKTDEQNNSSNVSGSARNTGGMMGGVTTPAGTATSTGNTVNPNMVMPPGMMPGLPSLPVAGVGVPGVTTPGVTTPGVTTPGVTTPPTAAAVADFQYLPMLTDTDGNPNDNNATYNLSADTNVPVTVVTPNGTWTTPMMRYNSLPLPPVIVAKRGTNIRVNVQNKLQQATTVHWHGFKIPAVQDGGPDEPIAPGASRTYNFQISQAAAPLWFHPHAEGTTAVQVYSGLAGAFVITDDITQNLETTKQLPSGAYDIPLLVQDRTFLAPNAAGVRGLFYGGGMMGAGIGDTMLVNGVVQPTLRVDTRQYRFKIYNASNGRNYDFALSNGAIFSVIGTDGGLLAAPVRTDHVLLGAGERAEIVVDFRGMALNSTVSLVNRLLAAGTTASELMRFSVATQAVDDVTLYSSLPANADINQRTPAASATSSRNFVLNTIGMMQFAINSRLFSAGRIDERVNNGATEVWTITNTTMMAHPFHAHAIQWQVLDRGGVPANGIDLGWKDTVLVQPGETVRIIGKFDPIINQGLYYYHCHILEHEEAGMMGSFFIQ